MAALPANSNKLKAVLAQVAEYASHVPGLMAYIESNIAQAASIVGDLAKVNKELTFSQWKASALFAIKQAGIQGQAEWQDFLLNTAYEAAKGESQRFFLFRWFIKAKEFLTRSGLNVFIAAAIKPALAFFEEQIATPNATFDGVAKATFGYVKSAVPSNKDTWIALVVNIVKIVIAARS